MKRISTLLLSALFVALLATSCGEKLEAPPIDGLEIFTDEVNQMSVKYPKNWDKISKEGKFSFFISNKALRETYVNYRPNTIPGAYIKLTAYKLDSARSVEDIIAKHKESLKAVSPEIKEITMEGVKATVFKYEINFPKGKMDGYRVIAAKDSGLATELTIDCYGGSYEKYKTYVEEIKKSFKLAATPAPMDSQRVVHVQDTFPPPTKTLDVRSFDGFSMGIPENCMREKTKSGKDVIKTIHYTAMARLDCGIRVDIKDGKDVDLKKQAENNKGLYGGKAPKMTKLNGETAYKFTYSPAASISRTIWYVKKNNKIYIITLDYFKKLKDDYFPPFDKAIKSIKFD